MSLLRLGRAVCDSRLLELDALADRGDRQIGGGEGRRRDSTQMSHTDKGAGGGAGGVSDSG